MSGVHPKTVVRSRFVCTAMAALPLLFGVGCHSAFVDATIANHTGATIRLVEVDYPSASFGTSELADGGTFKYRFKVLGSGPAKLSWTDLHEGEHNATGPALQEGEEGHLSINVSSDGVRWQPELHASH